GEIALDIEMVSAICPNCHILLVESDSTSVQDLGMAENTAVGLGAVVVSNSYAGPEFLGENLADSAYYNHPGVAITVGAGDDGYGGDFPASSPTSPQLAGPAWPRQPTHAAGRKRPGTWSAVAVRPMNPSQPGNMTSPAQIGPSPMFPPSLTWRPVWPSIRRPVAAGSGLVGRAWRPRSSPASTRSRGLPRLGPIP